MLSNEVLVDRSQGSQATLLVPLTILPVVKLILTTVHSFGTEGRKGNPSEEIAPSDNVFEFIVFRGSDIKDLQVFEPPAPKPAAPTPQQYPNDPAIMVGHCIRETRFAEVATNLLNDVEFHHGQLHT